MPYNMYNAQFPVITPLDPQQQVLGASSLGLNALCGGLHHCHVHSDKCIRTAAKLM